MNMKTELTDKPFLILYKHPDAPLPFWWSIAASSWKDAGYMDKDCYLLCGDLSHVPAKQNPVFSENDAVHHLAPLS